MLGSDQNPGRRARPEGGREEVAADSIQSLEWWVDSLEPRLLRLEEVHLPDGFDLDFSLDSLVALEAILSSHFRDGYDLLTVDGRDLVACAAGYIGETLLRLAGGAWEWDDDHPVIRPDQETGLAPVAPAFLVVESVRARTGNVLRAVHSAFARAVAARAALDPSWSPTKDSTPGVDSQVVPLSSDFLTDWLAEREASFAGWADAHGGQDIWNFSAESLNALEAVTRQRLNTIADADKPEQQDFVNGACWYFGEVARRVHGAFWSYNGGDPDPYDPWTGYPFVWRDKKKPHGSVPFYVLQVAVEQKGFLQLELARFA